MGIPPQSARPLAEFDKLEKFVLQVPGFSVGYSLFVSSLLVHFRGLHSYVTDQASLSMQAPRPCLRHSFHQVGAGLRIMHFEEFPQMILMQEATLGETVTGKVD